MNTNKKYLRCPICLMSNTVRKRKIGTHPTRRHKEVKEKYRCWKCKHDFSIPVYMTINEMLRSKSKLYNPI